MRFWIRLFLENRMTEDTAITIDGNDTRTHKVFAAIDKACYDLDICRPIWLDTNINDFKRYSKVRFYKDSFIEEVPFDYMEFSVLEED